MPITTVCKNWNKWIHEHTTHIKVTREFNNLVCAFPHITHCKFLVECDEYEILTRWKRLQAISWGGTSDMTFGQCPRGLLDVMGRISSLRHVHMHHKEGSCSTCAERYGWLKQLKTLKLESMGSLRTDIRSNIVTLKNLEHLALIDCRFDATIGFQDENFFDDVCKLDHLKKLSVSENAFTAWERKQLKKQFGKKMLLTAPYIEDQEDAATEPAQE